MQHVIKFSLMLPKMESLKVCAAPNGKGFTVPHISVSFLSDPFSKHPSPL